MGMSLPCTLPGPFVGFFGGFPGSWGAPNRVMQGEGRCGSGDFRGDGVTDQLPSCSLTAGPHNSHPAPGAAVCRGPPLPSAWGVPAQPRGPWGQPSTPRDLVAVINPSAWLRPRGRGCAPGHDLGSGVHPTAAWLGFITGKWGLLCWGCSPRASLRSAPCSPVFSPEPPPQLLVMPGWACRQRGINGGLFSLSLSPAPPKRLSWRPDTAGGCLLPPG